MIINQTNIIKKNCKQNIKKKNKPKQTAARGVLYFLSHPIFFYLNENLNCACVCIMFLNIKKKQKLAFSRKKKINKIRTVLHSPML